MLREWIRGISYDMKAERLRALEDPNGTSSEVFAQALEEAKASP
jgi:hypothetical protein